MTATKPTLTKKQQAAFDAAIKVHETFERTERAIQQVMSSRNTMLVLA